MKVLVSRYKLTLGSIIDNVVEFNVEDTGIFNNLNLYYDENMYVPLKYQDLFLKELDTILENSRQEFLDKNTELKIANNINYLISSWHDKKMLFTRYEMRFSFIDKEEFLTLNKYEYFNDLVKYLNNK